MKALSNQKGFSYIEIMVALVIMASVTAYIGNKVSSQRRLAADEVARTQVSDLGSLFSETCGRMTGADQLVIVENPVNSQRQNTVGCGERLESSRTQNDDTMLIKLVHSLGEGVRGAQATVEGRILNATRDDLNGSRNSDDQVATFCQSKDGSVSGTIWTDSSEDLDASDCAQLIPSSSSSSN